jgi:methylated-DNA-[protein]-cysteine S-methyltransferase
VEALGHCTFATAIGRCGIAWSASGICGVQLPEASGAALEARMRRRFAGVAESAPTEEAKAAIDGVRALLGGERVDLSFVRLDMDGVSPLHRDVYRLARAIAPGETRTYGELARALGKPGAARAIGQAMGRNPFAPVVPCHRVVAASGAGGFSAGGGVATKLRLLDIERRGGPGPLPLFDAAARSR